jgi:RNA polymerase sigma factor (sigma-70 family)
MLEISNSPLNLQKRLLVSDYKRFTVEIIPLFFIVIGVIMRYARDAKDIFGFCLNKVKGNPMSDHNVVERSMVELSDARLAECTLAGDQAAFETLVRRYYTPIFSFVRHFLGDYDLACDIVQQVFVRLYTSLPNLRKGEPFKAWLFQVARYCCIDEVRRQHRQAVPFSMMEPDYDEGDSATFSLDDIPDPGVSLEEEQEQRDIQRTLLCAIDALPPKFRAVVMLRYAGQLKFAEIGRVLHMPEPTAKTYFARARTLLRKNLAELREVVTV